VAGAGGAGAGGAGAGGVGAGARSASRRGLVVAAAAVVLAGLGVGLWVASGSSSSAQIGPEGVPLQPGPALASADTTAPGTPVDGITCRTAAEQKVSYHIHTLVEIFVDGNQVHLPAGAGIPTPRLVEQLPGGVWMDNSVDGCLYWLHVHTNDGVVHVEAPYRGNFTLGEFFDIWRQPLTRTRVGPARGAVVAFVNGRRFRGSLRDIPLLDHGVIQLDVGSPVVPFHPVRFTVNDLCGGNQSCAAS
jgi:hypothetical protein